VKKGISRQRKWQIKQHDLGNCLVCGKKAVSKFYCYKHTLEARKRNRNRVRQIAGIPFDAPLSKRGRPRLY
jgi:hypothetical protein